MNAVINAPRLVGKHAKNTPVIPLHIGKSSDPVLDDLHASATATALDLCSSQLKHLSKAGGISASAASRWRTHGRGNPLFDLTTVIYGLMQMGQHAGMLVAHAMTTLNQSIMPLSDSEVVARWWSLMGEESDAEGRENRAQAMFAATGDLEGLERETLKEAGIQTELAAVCRELRRRRIDPRTFGK